MSDNNDKTKFVVGFLAFVTTIVIIALIVVSKQNANDDTSSSSKASKNPKTAAQPKGTKSAKKLAAEKASAIATPESTDLGAHNPVDRNAPKIKLGKAVLNRGVDALDYNSLRVPMQNEMQIKDPDYANVKQTAFVRNPRVEITKNQSYDIRDDPPLTAGFIQRGLALHDCEGFNVSPIFAYDVDSRVMQQTPNYTAEVHVPRVGRSGI